MKTLQGRAITHSRRYRVPWPVGRPLRGRLPATDLARLAICPSRAAPFRPGSASTINAETVLRSQPAAHRSVASRLRRHMEYLVVAYDNAMHGAGYGRLHDDMTAYYRASRPRRCGVIAARRARARHRPASPQASREAQRAQPMVRLAAPIVQSPPVTDTSAATQPLGYWLAWLHSRL